MERARLPQRRHLGAQQHQMGGQHQRPADAGTAARAAQQGDEGGERGHGQHAVADGVDQHRAVRQPAHQHHQDHHHGAGGAQQVGAIGQAVIDPHAAIDGQPADNIGPRAKRAEMERPGAHAGRHDQPGAGGDDMAARPEPPGLVGAQRKHQPRRHHQRAGEHHHHDDQNGLLGQVHGFNIL
ncbi:hypothetical protein D3C81_1670660 [compost metagenome]